MEVPPVAREPTLLADIAANKRAFAFSLHLDPKHIDGRLRIDPNWDVDTDGTRVGRCCSDNRRRRHSAEQQ